MDVAATHEHFVQLVHVSRLQMARTMQLQQHTLGKESVGTVDRRRVRQGMKQTKRQMRRVELRMGGVESGSVCVQVVVEEVSEGVVE